jgi:lysozyme family protein
MTDRFTLCLPFTLAQECPHPQDWSNPANFSNDAHDPGGKTMCGIIQREYDLYRKSKGLLTQDVRKLTQAEGEDIYEHSYWMPDCPKLPPGLDLSFFDASVNMGTTEATKILQVALAITGDGNWGPKTQAAVVAANPITAIRAFAARRHTVYAEMPGFKYFSRDWTWRTNDMLTESLKMAGG